MPRRARRRNGHTMGAEMVRVVMIQSRLGNVTRHAVLSGGSLPCRSGNRCTGRVGNDEFGTHVDPPTLFSRDSRKAIDGMIPRPAVASPIVGLAQARSGGSLHPTKTRAT